jgi:hypothetical protein
MAQKILNVAPGKQMQFAPVQSQEDDDELSQAILNDPAVHDDKWDLTDNLDPEKLSAFWDDALHELGALEPEESAEE